MNQTHDRLEAFGIYRIARQLFADFWDDSEILGRDYRGRELVKQQVRSLDSICANIEEGYGRGFGKEWPQHLRIARGEARESKGRYERCKRLLAPELVAQRIAALDQIIGGLAKTINTLERKNTKRAEPASSLVTSSPVTPSPVTSSPATRHGSQNGRL